MTVLERKVTRARQRLMANILLDGAAVAILIATGLWGLVFLVERVFVFHIPVWTAAWLALALAAVITVVMAYYRRVSPLEAAAVVDQSAGLKERLSTALALARSPAADAFAQLAVVDAEKRAATVHVPAYVRYRAPRLWPWTTAAVVAAVILGFTMPELNLLARGKDKQHEEQLAAALAEQKAINQDLDVQLSQFKTIAENNPALKDVAADLEPLEMPDQPTTTPEDVRREAAQKIDNVTDRLAAQQSDPKLEGLRDTQRLLSRLDPMAGQDPGAQLSQSLAQGDFEGARKALEAMKKQLEEAAKSGDAASQQKLQQMQQQLQRLADQLAQLDDATYLRKELQNKAGLSEADAQKLLDKLSKMDPKEAAKELQRQMGGKGMSQQQIQELVKKFEQKQQARKSCQNMGKCLAQAAQAVRQCSQSGGGGGGSGSAEAAAASLADAVGQLSDMEMSEQLLNELEAQISDLRNMRQSICNGRYGGCPKGNCRRPDGRCGGIGPQGPRYGYGIGDNTGKERVAHALDPTRLKSRMQGGTIIGQMLIDGPQMRGQATAEVREAVNAAQRDAQDAIDRDEVPRQYQSAVQEYFLRLAGLLNRGTPPPATQPDQPAKP
jgi:RNA polymerase-binding transcription factor DksA